MSCPRCDLADECGTIAHLPGRTGEVTADLPALLVEEICLGRRLVGLVSHPTDSLDLYAYAGMEQASQTSFSVGTLPFGYGNPLYNNTACLHEAASVTAAATNCAANTSRVWEITGGFWWDVYKGDFGRLGGWRSRGIH